MLVLTAQTINLLRRAAHGSRRPRNAQSLFGLTLAAATLRHNAILWTLPLLVCALFVLPWGRRGAALAAGAAAAGAGAG